MFSWSPKVGLGLELSDIKLAADARLDAVRPRPPGARPHDGHRAGADPRTRGGAGEHPAVAFTVRYRQRKLSLTGDFAGLKFDLGSRTARVSGELKVEVLPTQRPIAIESDLPEVRGQSLDTNLAVGLADVRMTLDGQAQADAAARGRAPAPLQARAGAPA